MPDDNLVLTDEEIKTVNDIIKGIQLDLIEVLEHIKNNDFDSALLSIRKSLSKTDCPVCQKKLKLLRADISHTKEICILDEDLCTDEKKVVQDTITGLKNDFVPMATEKRALKQKEEETKIPIIPIPTPLEVLQRLFNVR